MTEGAPYIFCLQDKNYNFWKLTSTGDVVISSEPYFLVFAPDGWNEIAIQNIVNKTYKGVDRIVSVPLNYVADGAAILKYIAYTLGIREDVYLVIASQQLSFKPPIYGSTAVLTGANPFNAGVNTGTVTVPAGQTVYVEVFMDFSTLSDTVTGTITGTNYVFNLDYNNPSYILEISTAGTYNYSFTYTTAGFGNARIRLVNVDGSPTGGWGFWYKKIFRGAVDWPTFVHDGTKVTCTTLEDGMAKHLKANDKTLFEFPMVDLEAVFVKLDGINLHEKLNYIAVDGLHISVGVGNGQILPFLFINNEGNSTGVLYQSQNYVNVSGGSDPFTASEFNYILHNANSTPVTFTFTGVLEMICTARTASIASVTFRAGVSKNGVSVSSQQIGGNNYIPTLGVTTSLPVAFTMTLGAGETGFIYAMSNLTGTVAKYQFTPNTKLSAKYITRFPATYCRAFRPQTLFQKLIDKVTNGEFSADISPFLEENKTMVITCGDAIRSLDDAVIKISLDIYFKAFDCWFSVVLQDIKKKVYIGEEKNMYELVDTVPLREPAYNSLKVSFMRELMFNVLKIGYPEVRSEIGLLNGREDFNDQKMFSTDSTSITGELDKTCPIKTSPYEIEITRVTTFQKDSTNYRTDNDLFALKILDDLQPILGLVPPHYLLDRTLNPFITEGLTEPETVFNLFFTPARNFLRMGSHLRGRFYKADGTKFFFRTGTMNKNLICDGVEEDADRLIGDLEDPIAVPVQFDMEVPVDQSPISILEMNPLTALEFPWKTGTFKGLLLKISLQASKKNTQQVQLRSTADNDLTKLIKYIG